MVIPFGLLTIPDAAQAGILSMVTSLFSAQAAVADEPAPSNSQKMALLEAPLNSNANAGQGSSMITQGSALVADSAFMDGTSIPEVSNEITTYTVKKGDTMGTIAEKYSISVNTIIWANNLKRSEALKVGQELVILPISGVQHKVKSGDTIQAIAKKYKGDADEIMAYNDIDNASLKIGDIIVIPDGEVVVAPTAPKPKAPVVGTSKLASVSSALSGDTAVTKDYFARPIAAGVRTQGLHGNNGVDLADSCGTPIYASAAGTVLISKPSGWNGGYGNYIVINHSNGSQTLYSHMQGVSVSEGTQVSRGQVIGTIGNTGKVHGATGCHLHFEIRNSIRNPF